MKSTLVTLLCAIALSGLVARGESQISQRNYKIELCIVSAIDDIDVPAQESGPLVETLATEGHTVQRGALLAQIQDERAQLDRYTAILRRNAALARAEDDVDVRIATATMGVAQQELDQRVMSNNNSSGVFSKSEIRRLELTRDQAKFGIAKAELDMKIAKMSADSEEAAVRAAEDDIARRKIVSPIDGSVVNVYRQAGEWVNAGEPVVRLVRMDQLRVEGRVSARDYNPSEIDQRPVTVEIELARGRKVQLPGKVVYVSPIVRAGNIYHVRAEVENRSENGHWLLRPGATAEMTIHLR